MSTSITTALTIIGSFGAASTAQIVSHILTQKRENKKYLKECLQNLYSPNIFKLIDYISLHARNYSPLSNDVYNTEKLFQEALNSISDNLKYADAELINVYQENRSIMVDIEHDYEDDDEFEELLDDYELTYRIEFANLFFSQYIEINQKLNSSSTSINEKLLAPYFFTHFYLLVKDCYPYQIESAEIFEMYDLIQGMLFQKNNFLKSIKQLRREIHIVMNTSAYKDQQRVTEAFVSAYQFLYELLYEFYIFSPERTNNWKKTLDENLPSNRPMKKS
ncbi:hypothetical protein [Heyndrickxia oleronia]|uniref:hypothetical protein n=1 Tax=Heyndrickxia oleronia TaxID=38875 RepID=UPI001C0F0A1A|nr:hypothetical protein [Heyndrickxia oleronia]MBU5214993.1 hypothetical protein [Heyndrickxia oleronia]